MNPLRAKLMAELDGFYAKYPIWKIKGANRWSADGKRLLISSAEFFDMGHADVLKKKIRRIDVEYAITRLMSRLLS